MSFPSVSDTCNVFPTSKLILEHISKMYLSQVVILENGHMFRPSVFIKTRAYFDDTASVAQWANSIVDMTLPPRQRGSVCICEERWRTLGLSFIYKKVVNSWTSPIRGGNHRSARALIMGSSPIRYIWHHGFRSCAQVLWIGILTLDNISDSNAFEFFKNPPGKCGCIWVKNGIF